MSRFLSGLIRLFKGALLAVLILLVVIIGAFAFLFSSPGRPLLADGIERAAQQFAGLDLEIGEIGPGLPTRIAVSGVKLRDDQGAWLQIEEALVSWSARALLSGRVRINDVSGSGIEVFRAPPPGPAAEPAAEPEPDDEPLAIPQVPVDVQVDRIDIDALALGPDLLGEAYRLRITGQLAAMVGGMIRSDLAIERLDGSGGRITAGVALDPAAETLAVDVVAREPEGGLIVRALNLEPFPPLEITVTGEGPLDAWSGDVTAVLNGLADLSFDIRYRREARHRLALTGGGTVDGLVPADVRPLVEGGVTLDLIVTTEGTDQLTAETLTVETAALRLTAGGEVDLDAQEVDARATLATREARRLAALVAPATFDSITVEATAAGALAAPAVAVSVSAPSLAVPGQVAAGPLALTASAEPEGDDAFRITADLQVGQIEAGAAPDLGRLLPEGLSLRLNGRVAADTSRVHLDALTLNAGPIRADATGRVDLAADQAALRAEVAVAELSALSDLAGMPLSGGATLTATTEGTLAAPDLQGDVALVLDNAAIGDPAVDALLSPSATLAARYRLDGSQTLNLEPLTLAAGPLRGEGRLRLEDGLTAVDAAVTLVVAELAPMLRAAGTAGSGRIAVDLTASGPVADPAVNATVTTSNLTVAGNRIDPARVTAMATNVATAPRGNVRLNAGTPYGPVRGAVDFSVANGEVLRAPRLELSAAGLDLTGNLTAALAAGTVDGRVRGQWRPGGGGLLMGAQRIGGRADLAIDLAAPTGRQRLTARLTAADLVVAERGGAETVQIDSLTLAAAVDDAFGEPSLQASLEASDLAAAGRTVDRLDAEIRGALRDAPFSLAMVGGEGVPAALRTSGRLGLGDGATTVRLESLEGTLADQSLALAGPATVTLGEAVEVANLVLTVGDGSIAVDGRLADAGPTLALRIADLPLALAAMAAPDLSVSGSLDVEVDLSPRRGLLAGTVTARVRDLERGVSRVGLSTVPPLDIRANATIADGRLDAELRVVDIGGDDLIVLAELPAAINAATLTPRDPGTAPISGSVRWAGNLEPLIAAAPVEDLRMTGQGRINLDIAGTLAAPQVSGDISAEQGRLEHLVTGTQLEDLTFDIGVDAERNLTASLTGTDGEDGTIELEAEVGLAGLETGDPITIEARVQSRAATLVRRDDVTATADADISYVDRGEVKRLDGRIETRRVEIRLINQLPPSVVVLDVTEIDAQGNVIRDDGDGEAAADPIALDIDVNMPARVFVRGRGLDSEWQGNLDVSGTLAKPDVKGRIELVRGTLTVVGRRFELTEGLVDLRGGGAIDPEITLVAQSSVRGVTGTIRITGTASDPQIAMSASDGRPESEVLPFLLFGKRSDELGASEALQLALALDTLRGGTSDDIGFSAREALGLDVLSLETGEGGNDAAVRAGTYLDENIYVETRQGTQPGTSTYRAEIRLTDRISIEAQLGDGDEQPTGSIGLKWELEY